MIRSPSITQLLLVEDNDDHAMLIKASFDERLINVLHVRSAELARIELEKPDNFSQLLLVDIKLPNWSGIDLLRWIKSEKYLAVIPVIMLTTSANPRDIADSYSSGASGYITKPVGFKAMREKLQRFQHYWLEVSVTPDHR